MYANDAVLQDESEEIGRMMEDDSNIMSRGMILKANARVSFPFLKEMGSQFE